MTPQALIIYGLSALMVTALLTLLGRKPAQAIGLVDHPGGRKHHEIAVPLCGGPAMVGAFVMLVLMFGVLPSARDMGLLGGVLLLALIGGWDDLRNLSAGKRFVAHILVVLLCMVWFGNQQLTSLGNIFGLGDINLGIAQIPFTVFCVVGIINAVNLIDGIDGLAGGLVVIALNCFAAVALAAGELDSVALLTLLTGGTIGFLLFNLRTRWRARASVFLGDSGSTALGFILCWFTIDLTQGGAPAMAPITAVWILALPLMDTVNVMINRMLRGDRPFRPTREHLHHVMLALGYTPRQTVRLLLAIALSLSGIGLAADYCHIEESLMCLSFIGLFLIFGCAMRFFWRRRYRQFIKNRTGSRRPPSFAKFMRGSGPTAPINRVVNVQPSTNFATTHRPRNAAGSS